MGDLGTWIRETVKRSRFMRRVVRRWRTHVGGYPDWQRIIDWDRWNVMRDRARGGPKVLIATSVGAHLPASTMESLLAVALTMRGAEVSVLLCDAALPACLESDSRWHKDLTKLEGLTRGLCTDCFEPTQRMFRSLGFPVLRYGEFLTAEDIAASREGSGIEGSVGEHAKAGALRFYARGTLEEEPQAAYVVGEYNRAAILAARSLQKLFAQHPFQVVAMHHGIYVPQGLVVDAARQAGVRVVTWNPSYRKKCFLFSHEETYHHTFVSEPVSKWENMPWTPEMESKVLNYVESRARGVHDWLKFHHKPQEDVAELQRELGVDFSKPCVGMLTNVMWDAQLNFRHNAFPNMLDWTLRTVDYFRGRPDLQLILRSHPGEIRGTLPSRQPILGEIRKAFSELPKNIVLVSPESRVGTYAAMRQCNAVLVYGTNAAIDLSALGVPVIVAGEAWVRGKGITTDVESAEHYFQLLDALPMKEGMSPERLARARKYAFHFFFRRMVPLECLEPIDRWPLFKVRDGSFDEMEAGRSPGLDVLCEGILKGTDFIYPAERLPVELG